MNLEHLRTLAAIVDEGSFEGAGFQLGVSPSAVSQRIKALETSVGQLLVRRETPCIPTPAGAAVVRLARQVQLLEAETWQQLGQTPGRRSRIPVAVNADSLATWFIPVFTEMAEWEDTVLDLHVEDQDHSSALLRSGDVIGAITSDPRPIPGCSIETLGSMRYVAAATPALAHRYTDSEGTPDWRRMPVIRFNDKDDLQHEVLRSHGVDMPETIHTVPSSQGFHEAVRAGLGWGMLPELQMGSDMQVGADVAQGRLQTLHAAVRPGSADGGLVAQEPVHRDVALYWQTWGLESARLHRITAAIRKAAEGLR
ncbi:LysR family transcriptional regulator ArgP [Nesterenkonia flava]|uniref:LysR family transcriptional regulator ArgP n=1 Tax=Nesterenkonia flava TaxID=469799 RepID=A0ABU1FSG6_9MICC|nr:LysR family transcriptional regulator ArgP [Nesterenkonia flava]MDR5711606.1 LysR family transcriptional regulator ArgP [Nesterenkonia flava]